MATSLDVTLWSSMLAYTIQHAKLDDYAAMAVLTLMSVAYLTKGSIWAKTDPYAYKMYEIPQQSSPATAQKPQSQSLAKRLEEANANIAILWASQSGTAEQYAARLVKEINRNSCAKALLVDISDIEPSSCAELSGKDLLIFLASTFGEGDPSDNMHKFWSWIHRSNPASLSNLRFLAFGLGNSNYKHYNHVVNVLVERLNACGAQLLSPVSRADDATGESEEHFLEWKCRVLELLENRLGYRRQQSGYAPSIAVVEDRSTDLLHGVSREGRPPKTSQMQSKIASLPVVESRPLYSGNNDRHCVHLEVDLQEHLDLKYKTGDHLGVWPVNPTQEVERLMDLLCLHDRQHAPLQIKSLDGNDLKVPTPTTLRSLFEHHLEICSPVSREHVQNLATFAPTMSAKNMLQTISSNKVAYAEFLSDKYVSFGRLLQISCGEPGAWKDLPLSLVVETLPSMRPRYYSICSSSVIQPKRAAIAAVIADTIVPKARIPGLATNYLLSLDSRPHPYGMSYSSTHAHGPPTRPCIQAHVRKSAFKLPMAVSTPIVMVGAGTGVAPFRAFIQERARLKAMGREVGSTKLFFGCRNMDEDFIYRSDFEDLSKDLADIFTIYTAFSRPAGTERKRYVQDRIVEEAEVVARLLVDENAYFYICGSAAMARDVSNAVAKVIMAKHAWSEKQVSEFADRQRGQRRWLQDVWG